MNALLSFGSALELRDPSWLALLALPAWLWLRRPVGPALTFAPAALLAPRAPLGAGGASEAGGGGGGGTVERFPSSWRVASRWLLEDDVTGSVTLEVR